ncbi:hypothetical protein [Luteimicrobium xylanilyticum]|uniref:hypothetical protein n=1 Tax=Luteimicrobium xylanilyticum TaxID=1133546 RepID=UPI00129016FF|nr:hypothetical protein [Luteimicrobium xylanilyticum]
MPDDVRAPVRCPRHGEGLGVRAVGLVAVPGEQVRRVGERDGVRADQGAQVPDRVLCGRGRQPVAERRGHERGGVQRLERGTVGVAAEVLRAQP